MRFTFSGSGVKNKTIMQGLTKRLKGTRVFEYHQLGIPLEAKEAVLMALLANEHMMGNPSNLRKPLVQRRTWSREHLFRAIFRSSPELTAGWTS